MSTKYASRVEPQVNRRTIYRSLLRWSTVGFALIIYATGPSNIASCSGTGHNMLASVFHVKRLSLGIGLSPKLQTVPHRRIRNCSEFSVGGLAVAALTAA